MNKYFNKIKKLHFYDIFKYSSFNILAKVFINSLNALVLLYVLKKLSTNDYGITEIFLASAKILAPFVIVNIGAAYSRYVFDDKYNRQTVLINTSVFTVLSISIIYLVCYVFKDVLLQLFNLQQEYFNLLFLYIFSSSFFNYIQLYYYAKKKVVISIIIDLVFNVARVASILFFLEYFGFNSLNKIRGEICFPLILSTLVLLFVIQKLRSNSLNFKLLKEMLKYSSSLFAISLSGMLLNFMDAIMLSNIDGYVSSGTYSFAYKIVLMYYSLIIIINTVYKKDLFTSLQHKKINEVALKINSIIKLNLFLLIIFVSFSFLIPLILKKPDYIISVKVLPVLLLAFLFSLFADFCVNIFSYYKNVKIINTAFIFSAVLNFLLNFLLIKPFGVWGASTATLISYIAMFILLKYYLDKKNADIFKFKSVLIYLIIAILALLGVSLIGNKINSLYLHFILACLISIAMFLILYYKEVLKLLSKK